jgi:hypothetical protein
MNSMVQSLYYTFDIQLGKETLYVYESPKVHLDAQKCWSVCPELLHSIHIFTPKEGIVM